jgi:hypothetical protein
MRNRIVFIHTDHPNDFEATVLIREAFAAFGYVVDDFSTGDPNFAPKFSALINEHHREIFCFISSNYTAADIIVEKTHLHIATGIPLVFCLFDHPIYSMAKHVPSLADAMLWVQGEDAADFVTARGLSNSPPIVQTGPFPQHFDHPAPDFEEFLGRRNEIICPMNLHVWGVGLDTAWQNIRELPTERRQYAKTLVEQLMYDGTTPAHARAEELRQTLGAEPATALADTQLAITFLKLWRRDRMVRSLIDLPILISTEWVPPDLEFRFPEKFTLLSMAETLPLYSQFRFVLNAYPLITHTFHDRVLRALFANAVCISDANVVMSRIFRDDVDMIFFDYHDPDRTAARIGYYLDDPAASFALTVSAYETTRRNKAIYFEGYERFIEAVKRKWNASETAR